MRSRTVPRKVAAAAMAVILMPALLTAFPSPAEAATDDTLVSGVILSKGAPKSGVDVTVELWPDETPVTVGEKVEVLRVATIKTDKNGNYRIKVDPRSVPSRYKGHGSDTLNMEITATGDGRVSTWFTSATTPAHLEAEGAKLRDKDRSHEWLATNSAQREVTSTSEVSLDLQSAPAAPMQLEEAFSDPSLASSESDYSAPSSDGSLATADYSAGSNSESEAAPAQADVEGSSDVQAQGGVGCGRYLVGSAGSGYETFARVFAVSKAKGRIDFETTATHALGVGYSTSGAYGSWSMNGTVSKSAGIGMDSGNTIVNANVKNKVAYNKYGYACSGSGTYAYRILPSHTMGIGYYSYAGTASFTNFCQPGAAGGTYWRTSGSNKTFSTGIAIAGVGLSAQSGYASNAKHSYYFSSAGKWCGSNSKGMTYSALMRSA